MGRKIIAYFSAEGSTEKVAKALAKITGADIFSIVPTVPYTASDINWKNPLARCNKEKIGKKDVPVEGRIDGFEDYDTVFLGFPIWYYGAPNVVNTFVKGYDWSGKKIVLFATSGGSDMGKTAQKLEPYLKGDYKIAAQKLIRPSDKADDLKKWVSEII